MEIGDVLFQYLREDAGKARGMTLSFYLLKVRGESIHMAMCGTPGLRGSAGDSFIQYKNTFAGERVVWSLPGIKTINLRLMAACEIDPGLVVLNALIDPAFGHMQSDGR